jgi:Lrp/AsnC family leucine-responsive transcriptional regulator
MLQLELLVFVEISLLRTSADVFADFKEAVIKLPQVLECHLVSGNFDYLIKARVADMADYRKLLGETLLTLPGVSESRTYVVMEELKETQALPL